MSEAVKGPASPLPLSGHGPSIEKLVRWLKAEHGVGHGHANALVGHVLAQDRQG